MPRYLVKQLGLEKSIEKIPYHIQLLIASEITMSIYAFKHIGAKSNYRSIVQRVVKLWREPCFGRSVIYTLDRKAYKMVHTSYGL